VPFIKLFGVFLSRYWHALCVWAETGKNAIEKLAFWETAGTHRRDICRLDPGYAAHSARKLRAIDSESAGAILFT